MMPLSNLNYSTREINLDFRIKVSGKNNGASVNTLVGVSGLINYVGDIEVVNGFIERAYRLTSHKCICKLRRGLKITFYQK